MIFIVFFFYTPRPKIFLQRLTIQLLQHKLSYLLYAHVGISQYESSWRAWQFTGQLLIASYVHLLVFPAE